MLSTSTSNHHRLATSVPLLSFFPSLLFALSSASAQSPVTFNQSVAPIFQKHCQNCHRPGEIAPMSLLSYEDSRPWAKAIKTEVAARRMPPWHADAKPGQFSNDIGMTGAEIESIVQWVDDGALEGDAKDLPPPIKWESKEWELGPPDYFFQPAAAFTVPPTKPDQDLYQCIVIPTNLQEDIWVDGFEYKVDNRKIVHHIVGFASVNGKAEQMDASTPEPGFPCGMGGANSVMLAASLDSMLGGWGPGVPANLNHPGTAKPLPKGSSILLQMHYYNQTGKEQLDRSGLAVHVAKGTVRARSRVMAVIAPPSSFFIKAGDANAGNRGQWAVPQDIMIYSLAAHMHNLGKAMKMTALYPDGASEILLDVPRYDFNWQRTYRLTEPKAIPKGTKILMESLHDNSASNPKNIHNPPVDIKWGESTTEEMSIGFVGYWNAAENLNIPPHGAPAKPGAAGGF